MATRRRMSRRRRSVRRRRTSPRRGRTFRMRQKSGGICTCTCTSPMRKSRRRSRRSGKRRAAAIQTGRYYDFIDNTATRRRDL